MAHQIFIQITSIIYILPQYKYNNKNRLSNSQFFDQEIGQAYSKYIENIVNINKINLFS